MKKWKTKVTTIKPGQLIARSIDQAEIIESWKIEEMIFLLLNSRRPSQIESDLLRAVILSHTGHGLTGQSSIAAVLGADTSSSFLNSMFAGFLVGSGPYHQGALQTAMEGLIEASHKKDKLEQFVDSKITFNERLFGFGHRYQQEDPRAQTLMRLAKKYKYDYGYVDIALRIEEILFRKKKIKMNIEAAGGSILLNLGFDPRIASLIIVLGRSTAYAAMYLERLQNTKGKPFRKVAIFDME
jgi:citrate synthase